ncbi:hypothetical protein MMC32_008295, partial [Xylographa parallela]|nr:hypothetical protein [Xylographa parallela]
MDPGTILAIVELSATTLSCIGKYYVGVKNARADIQRLSNEVEGFHDVLQKVQELVQSSQATRLPISTSFTNVAKQSLLDITALEKRLNPSKKERIMKRVGVRALAWPLTSKEVDECVTKLERYKSTLSLALNADQTSLLIDIDANVINLTQNQDLAEQNRQLATLPCAVGASFDSYFRQHESRCVPNTRVDLLNRLQKWSTDHERCIFWLNGMAGTGKSTIARTVAHIFYEQKSLGASFFFSRGVGDLGHAAHFVCTIAHQLADALPLLKRYICEAITKHHNIAMQGLRNQWKELVVQPLSKLNGQWPTLSLVIDALDECENQEDVKLILQLFVETKGLAGVNFGIFVTSRPETPIRLGFREMPDIVHQDLVLQDIPRSVVEHDITVFLQYQLYQIGSKRDIQGWPDETSIKLLVQASDCLFIYAATVCRFVGDPHWSPEQRLHLILQSEARGSRPTAKLDEMYTQILRCSITADQDMDEKAELGKRFKNVIGTIVLLFDVLPVPVLAALLSIPTKEVDLSLEPLHSLLRISRLPNLPIRLLHPSFRDFLLDHERCRNSYFWVNQRTVDQNIVTNCLQLLSNSLRKDICALKMPGASAPKLYDDIKFFLPIHVQYACQYWVDHLERLDWNSRIAVGLCDDGQVYNFLQTHLLNWLEALSLVGKTSRGIVIITKLESMLQ